MPLDRSKLQFILYVLDPEPELFALAAVHAFGRYGYNTGDDPDASILRKCAIVGVGHDSAAYEAGPFGFNVEALRDLRRLHFRYDGIPDSRAFLEALRTDIVPHCEQSLLELPEMLPRENRALLGCSLSSLLALRTVLRPKNQLEPSRSRSTGGGDVFGVLVCGSPSLIFTPELINEARRVFPEKSKKEAKHPVKLLFVSGETEARKPVDGGNGIPQAADYMAGLLRRGGHHVWRILLVHI